MERSYNKTETGESEKSLVFRVRHRERRWKVVRVAIRKEKKKALKASQIQGGKDSKEEDVNCDKGQEEEKLREDRAHFPDGSALELGKQGVS